VKTIHFVFYNRFSYFNQGDINALPLLYFNDFFKNYNVVVSNIFNLPRKKISPSDIVIFGGGGIIDDNKIWNTAISSAQKLCENVIIWGAGINTIMQDGTIKHLEPNVDYSKMKLVGVRDYNNPLGIPYTPCSSCLISYLEKKASIKHEIVQMIHPRKQDQKFINLDLPNLNHFSSLETIFDFISSSEVVLTTSYHCAFWAVLMKKKVIIPESKLRATKYYFYKYKPAVLEDEQFTNIDSIYKIIDTVPVYENALSESRSETLKFFSQVQNIVFNIFGDSSLVEENNFAKTMVTLSEYRSELITLNDRIKKLENLVNSMNENDTD